MQNVTLLGSIAPLPLPVHYSFDLTAQLVLVVPGTSNGALANIAMTAHFQSSDKRCVFGD